MKRQTAIVFLAILCLVGAAFATTTNLVSTIDGAQANAGAGTGSSGTGSATLTYDDVTNILTWNITWSGLTGTETVAHFHGPAAAGVNAGVQVNFAAISGLSSPSIGSTTITTTQAADLLNDLWYVNIHTDVETGGEIRGQILVDSTVPVEEPTWAAIKSFYR